MISFKLLTLSIILRLVATDLIPFDDWLYQRVALQDVNIYFRYAGTGPPVLLVHGFPEHSVSDPPKSHLVNVDDLADALVKAHVAYHWANSCPELHRDCC